MHEAANARPFVAVIGAGPAGVMAAEALITAGARVEIYERMPSVGRKLLMAGKGGLNITHAEPIEAFLARYGSGRARLEPLLRAFDPDALRVWVHGLGIGTFVGTSGRVFPNEMKAAPLLRAWLHRLRAAGVKINVRHRWLGWEDETTLRFETPQGAHAARPDAVVLALGGASWPQLGSDGSWVHLLKEHGVALAPLRSANSGFEVAWSDHFRTRFSGAPVKPVIASVEDAKGGRHRRQGEFVVTEHGVEGGLIYALSAPLRDTLEARGEATLHLDLAPDWNVARLQEELSRPRGSRSLSSHVQSRTDIKGVRMGLLREVLGAQDITDAALLARTIKALPMRLLRARPVAESISTAGGVCFEALDEHLMIRSRPGLFCAGEMLDWEAPTGGYLLSACFATGLAAGRGALRWLSTAQPAGETRERCD